MTSVTIEEAQAKLPELIHGLQRGETVAIIENNQTVAKLISEPSQGMSGLRPPPGLGKGYITIVAEDEDHLDDFAEYMP